MAKTRTATKTPAKDTRGGCTNAIRVNGMTIGIVIALPIFGICDCSLSDQCEGCGRDIAETGTIVQGAVRCECGETYAIREVASCVKG